MNELPQHHLANLWSTDRPLQNEAFFALLAATEQPVAWAYDIWDDLVANLSHKDNHNRAIASQILANLAAHSDPQNRILDDFDALYQVTRDERTVTARHSLQAIWKVALGGQPQKERLLATLQRRFQDAPTTDKHPTLVRQDIVQALRDLYEAAPDPALHESARQLIDTEEDLKYRKKYAGVWKDV